MLKLIFSRIVFTVILSFETRNNKTKIEPVKRGNTLWNTKQKINGKLLNNFFRRLQLVGGARNFTTFSEALRFHTQTTFLTINEHLRHQPASQPKSGDFLSWKPKHRYGDVTCSQAKHRSYSKVLAKISNQSQSCSMFCDKQRISDDG